MALAGGTRLGPYEILSLLGVGGMGEVYRARDRKLDRSVAIKILPEALVADPERIARFEREAKTLAALNHRTSPRFTGSKAAAAQAPWFNRWRRCLLGGPAVAVRLHDRKPGPVTD